MFVCACDLVRTGAHGGVEEGGHPGFVQVRTHARPTDCAERALVRASPVERVELVLALEPLDVVVSGDEDGAAKRS